MNTYTLRITCERAPHVWRKVQFLGRQTLGDVHAAIQDLFSLDDDHLYSFFLSGKRWDSETEYGHSDGDSPRRATRTKLDRLDLKPGHKFLYVFDSGDELWHELTVEAVGKPEAEGAYPRVLQQQGEAPAQHPHCEECGEPMTPIDGLQEIAERVTSLLDEIEENDDRSEAGPPPRDLVMRAHARAIELLQWIGDEPERLDALEDYCDLYLGDWLAEVPYDLADHGLVDEAVEFCERFAEVTLAEEFLPGRAFILAGAGRHAEALVCVKENLARFPEDAWVAILSGDALRDCGEASRAEECYQRADVLCKSDRTTRLAARRRLAELLESQGREQEAAALVNETASHRGKVGRNDRCACGSGRKYKKCCSLTPSGGSA